MTITSMTASPSRVVAAEIRAEAARQGISIRTLADRMGVTQMWLTRRVGAKSARVDLTLEETCSIAEALDVPVERFYVWLPRLDSNQQPSGYPLALVRRAA